jgi:hypothetical protein
VMGGACLKQCVQLSTILWMNSVVSDWMEQQIWPQIGKMMLDDAYFKLVGCARELTKKLNGPVAQIILDGYLTFQTVAIRRLCDPRKDVISLRRVLVEVKAENLACFDQTDPLLQSLDSCNHVCKQVNHHIAHTANPALRPDFRESHDHTLNLLSKRVRRHPRMMIAMAMMVKTCPTASTAGGALASPPVFICLF